MEADETLTAEDCATWFAAEYAKAVANEASEVLTPDKVEKYEHTQKNASLHDYFLGVCIHANFQLNKF